MQASTNTYWERVHLGELETAELLPPSQAYLTESWQNTKLTSYEKNVFTNWFTFTFSEKECFFLKFILVKLFNLFGKHINAFCCHFFVFAFAHQANFVFSSTFSVSVLSFSLIPKFVFSVLYQVEGGLNCNSLKITILTFSWCLYTKKIR